MDNVDKDLVSEDNLEAGAQPKKAQRLTKLPIVIFTAIGTVILLIMFYGVNASSENAKATDAKVKEAEVAEEELAVDGAERILKDNNLSSGGTINEKIEEKPDFNPNDLGKQQGIVGEDHSQYSKVDPATQKKFDDLEKKYQELLLRQQGNSLKAQGVGNQAMMEEQQALVELKKELANLRKQQFLNGYSGSSKTTYQPVIMDKSNGSSGSDQYSQKIAKAREIASDPNAPMAQRKAAAEILQKDAARKLANMQNEQNTGTASRAFGGNTDPFSPSFGSGSEQSSMNLGMNSTLDSYNGLNRNNQWDLGNVLEDPVNDYIVRAGFVIPAVLVSGINSDLAGQVIAQVSQSVYDTATGEHLLIPQGTRLIGSYASGAMYGQERVMISWQRLVFPDNRTLDIGTMPGTDTSGYSGFNDKVNNHWWKLISSAFLMSGITASVSIATDDSDSNSNNNSYSSSSNVNSSIREAMADQFGSVLAKVIERNLNIAPTIEIRPGYNFNVMVTKDLTFERDYKGFDYKNQQ